MKILYWVSNKPGRSVRFHTEGNHPQTVWAVVEQANAKRDTVVNMEIAIGDMKSLHENGKNFGDALESVTEEIIRYFGE